MQQHLRKPGGSGGTVTPATAAPVAGVEGDRAPGAGNEARQAQIRQRLELQRDQERVLQREQGKVERSVGFSLPEVALYGGAQGLAGAGGAIAAARGRSIFLGEDFDDMALSDQEEVIRHELSHVAQFLQPDGGAEGGQQAVGPEPDIEQDAERINAAAAAGASVAVGAAVGAGDTHNYTQAAPVPIKASPSVQTSSLSALIAAGGFSLTVNSKRKTEPDYEAAVVAAQTVLANLGYYSAAVDADFGSVTAKAVKAFQAAEKTLEVDGVVGPKTAAALDKAIGSSAGSSAVGQSEAVVSDTAEAARARVLKVLALAAKAERYDDVYDQGSNGDALRDYVATHEGGTADYQRSYVGADGKSAAKPTQARSADDKVSNPNNVSAYPKISTKPGKESGLGAEHLLEFIDGGGYDKLTKSERGMFLAAVDQLGSFYGGIAGQGNISNGFTWTPEGVSSKDQYSGGYVKQSEDQVGKWDCSSFASYVAGSARRSSAEMYNDPAARTVNWSKLRSAADLKAAVPVGSFLASDSHVEVVVGHIGAELMLMESEGSGHFVHAEMKDLDTLIEKYMAIKVLKPR